MSRDAFSKDTLVTLLEMLVVFISLFLPKVYRVNNRTVFFHSILTSANHCQTCLHLKNCQL